MICLNSCVTFLAQRIFDCVFYLKREHNRSDQSTTSVSKTEHFIEKCHDMITPYISKQITSFKLIVVYIISAIRFSKHAMF